MKTVQPLTSFLILKAVCAAAVSSLVLYPSAQAANTIYTNGSTTTTVSGNWDGVTWTQTGTASTNTFPTTTDAGSVAQNNGTANSTTTSTLLLDVPVTIGALYVGSQGTTVANWTITSDGNAAHFFTMDATGLSAANNPYGDAGVAAIASRSGGTLTINPNIVLATNIDVGTTSPQSGNLTINGNVTASTAATMTFRGSGSTPQANINGIVTVNGGIGASESTIALSNVRASSSGTVGNVVINGNLGSSVSTVTQNGAATMVLTGTNTYSGATTITSGTLQIQNGAAIPNASPVNMGGGILSIVAGSKQGAGATVTGGVASGTNTVGLGVLTLTANSTVDFDSASNGNLLSFASGFTPNGHTLTISDWTNAHFNGTTASGLSTDDRLIFAQNMSGNLTAFNFGSGAGVGVSEIALGGGFYEVGFTAVPEPATYVVALVSGGLIACCRLRRFQRSS